MTFLNNSSKVFKFFMAGNPILWRGYFLGKNKLRDNVCTLLHIINLIDCKSRDGENKMYKNF